MADSSILNSLRDFFRNTRGFFAQDILQNSIKELREVNTLLTEISKTASHLSKSELKQLGKDSFEISGKYGKKAADYLSGVQEASRAGYSNAADISELSVAAQAASDMTEELANQFIFTTDKSYELGGSIEKLTEVLDGSASISSHHSVTLSELANGMTAVSSHASALGVDVSETAAVLGTMIASTHESGSDMADAFKAILLNINQVTDEEEGITADGLIRYEEACRALNVSLRETKNGVTSLRDPMDVIRDLAKEYSQLGSLDVRKTNLLNSVGGGMNADGLNAILENYNVYEEMLQNYTQGTGSLATEAEKTADSWEGSMNRLANTWADTIGNIADSDAVITIINALNGLLSAGNSLTDWLGPAASIGLGAGLFAGIKNVGRDKMFSLI